MRQCALREPDVNPRLPKYSTPNPQSLFIRYHGNPMALHLITGVAGFIGSSIARALLEKGEQVRGIDNFATGKRENIAEIAKPH